MSSPRPAVPAADEILNRYFPVLDHGFVALIDYMGSDADVERAARVSYGYGTRQTSDTRGLIRYLRRHRHSTPTEMVELKFHCCMPMFIARQWIRHRTASVNEYSGRYSLMPMLFYTPDRDHLCKQSASNRQGREGAPLTVDEYENAVRDWNTGRAHATSTYHRLTGDDVAKELARIDLPLSTYTQWYWKIDLHNLLHFLTLRVDPHAQWEIRAYAEVMAGMVARVAPLTFEAWLDYDAGGARLSRMELEALRQALGSSSGTTVRDALAPAELETRMSPREVREFLAKLEPTPTPTFDLDLARARSPEWFADRFAAAVSTTEAHAFSTNPSPER